MTCIVARKPSRATKRGTPGMRKFVASTRASVQVPEARATSHGSTSRSPPSSTPRDRVVPTLAKKVRPPTSSTGVMASLVVADQVTNSRRAVPAVQRVPSSRVALRWGLRSRLMPVLPSGRLASSVVVGVSNESRPEPRLLGCACQIALRHHSTRSWCDRRRAPE